METDWTMRARRVLARGLAEACRRVYLVLCPRNLWYCVPGICGVPGICVPGICIVSPEFARNLVSPEFGVPGICSCNQVTFPNNKSNLNHIFSGTTGHFGSDTPQNRALILGTISPSFYVGSKYGTDIYRQTLANGTQVWVEVYDHVISNGGLNQTPIYGY